MPPRTQSPDTTRKARVRLWVAAILPVLLLAGCAGYRVGPTQGQVAGERSVRVLPFQNRTIEPRLVDALNNALRKTIQQDGTYRLETRDGGDILLTGTIKVFHRSQLSLNPQDVLTPRDYQLEMVVNVRATERVSGRVVVDRDVTSRTTIRVGNDLSSAERQAAPLLAEMLARRATSLLADGEW